MEDYKYFPTIMYIQIIIINLMNLDLISTITMMMSLPHTCTYYAIFNYKSAENLMLYTFDSLYSWHVNVGGGVIDYA